TIFGITVFLIRGKEGLNIDFVGGTAYGGQLVEAVDIGELRELLTEQNQRDKLDVQSVKQLDTEGRSFAITYKDGTTRKVDLPNSPTPDDELRQAQKIED